jgi:FtsP/CotA-like multicopper oxidase with cupredoxin domain
MRASRSFVVPVALAAALALVVAVAGTAAASPTVIVTQLTGEVEVPTGDLDGTGVAAVRLDADTGEVCWTYKVRDVATIFAAHIHVAPAGVAGPVVIPFTSPDPTSGVSVGCTTADPALVSAILSDPSGYYVNTHNAEFPAGALRGQLG